MYYFADRHLTNAGTAATRHVCRGVYTPSAERYRTLLGPGEVAAYSSCVSGWGTKILQQQQQGKGHMAGDAHAAGSRGRGAAADVCLTCVTSLIAIFRGLM